MSDDWKEFVEEVYEVAFGDSALIEVLTQRKC